MRCTRARATISFSILSNFKLYDNDVNLIIHWSDDDDDDVLVLSDFLIENLILLIAIWLNGYQKTNK